MLALHPTRTVPANTLAPSELKTHGLLAMQYCCLKLPLQVLTVQNGYYIGTQNEDGPVSRESVEYWPIKEHALKALEDGNWTQRDQP